MKKYKEKNKRNAEAKIIGRIERDTITPSN